MSNSSSNLTEAEFIERTKACLHGVVDTLVDELQLRDSDIPATLRHHAQPGKMLRTRLAYVLLPAGSADLQMVTCACAATELIHTATLYHDDVVDGANLRRGQPPLWKQVGATGAILLGDLYFSTAVDLLLSVGSLSTVTSFVRKVREVCAVEAAHELLLRGKTVDIQTSIRIARGKTGALFAFSAECCGGSDPALAATLAEVGYLVGTAYQIADDLVDECGSEAEAGKTLGTDRKRRKYTLAQAPGSTEADVLAQIGKLGRQALDLLADKPAVAASLRQYIDQYLVLPTHLHTHKVW